MHVDSLDQQVTKTFVSDDGNAIIICPECGEAREISLDELPERKPLIKVRCRCSCRFAVALESRSSYRKETNISGIFAMTSGGTGSGVAMIRNISLRGICFEIHGKHSIAHGHRGIIDFCLDNRNMTRMRKNFQVRGVVGNSIRCRFEETSDYEKELGFYLRADL